MLGRALELSSAGTCNPQARKGPRRPPQSTHELRPPVQTPARNMGMIGSAVWVRKQVGRSQDSVEPRSNPQHSDGPSLQPPSCRPQSGKQRPALPFPAEAGPTSTPEWKDPEMLACAGRFQAQREGTCPRDRGPPSGKTWGQRFWGEGRQRDTRGGGSRTRRAGLCLPLQPALGASPGLFLQPALEITSPISFPSEHSALPTRIYFPVSHPSESHRGSCLVPASPVPKTLPDTQ